MSEEQFMKELGCFFKHCLNIGHIREIDKYLKGKNLNKGPPSWKGWEGLGFTPYLNNNNIIEDDLIDKISKEKSENRYSSFEYRLLGSLDNYIEYLFYFNKKDKYKEIIDKCEKLLDYLEKNENSLKKLILKYKKYFLTINDVTNEIIKEDWNNILMEESNINEPANSESSESNSDSNNSDYDNNQSVDSESS